MSAHWCLCGKNNECDCVLGIDVDITAKEKLDVWVAREHALQLELPFETTVRHGEQRTTGRRD